MVDPGKWSAVPVLVRELGPRSQPQPLPDEHQRNERLQSLHSHSAARVGSVEANQRPRRWATRHAPASPPNHPSCQCSHVVRMHAAPHRRAHRRLLPPPKGLPMRSLRSRPSPSRASHRSQPRTAVGPRRLPCGAAHPDDASVSSTTLLRRTHGRTARPRAASSLLYSLSESPPSPTGASDKN